MFTFNIGPSQISCETKKDIQKLLEKDILQISHRSQEFSEISKQAIEGLRKFFSIPPDYKIFYTDSATHAMELCLLNCCEKKSFHFVNGVFSKLFSNIAYGLGKTIVIDEVKIGEKNDFLKRDIEDDVDFVSITHTETSSGVMCSSDDIKNIRKKYSNKILAIDITSSAGACETNISDADLWFFSVQKCFGLPSGLAICIVSPNAYEKSLRITNNKQVFSFQKMWIKMEEKYQTISTPNVFLIYLLAEKLKRWNSNGGLVKNILEAKEKKEFFSEFIKSFEYLDFFVKDEAIRADTLFYLQGNENVVSNLHRLCEDKSIILGKGYGDDLKKIAIRIANFPVIKKDDLIGLIERFKNI